MSEILVCHAPRGNTPHVDFEGVTVDPEMAEFTQELAAPNPLMEELTFVCGSTQSYS